MTLFGSALTARRWAVNFLTLNFLALGCLLLLPALGGCGRQPYDGRIASNSQQPDKLLYDKGVEDLEKRRYEQARLAFQTLMNTYPDSEYLSEAERAMEESWRREGKLPPAQQN
jgi:outer membrane protein assembly factor BamD (BamD/ComL family)